ncbi:MAG: hypothetical protein ACE37B_16520 [Ilumatobacter sp.]|uniref:hypothetical protein n=1 Tax=Ilumatobacter sp. TaxID=1967498 RepID=UPI00391C70FA
MKSLLRPALVAIGGLTLVACGGAAVVEGPADADLADRPPYGPGVEVGETYDYVLYVHCGVEWARVDGVWWRTMPIDDGNANPPAGWGNPYDAGELLVLDDVTAVYRGGPDVAVEFARTDIVEAPDACE